MRICFSEPTEPQNRGSMGAHYITESVKTAGYDVAMVPPDMPGEWDIELLSVHHVLDSLHLRKYSRRAPVRLLGGHPVALNPRLWVPHADVLCLGEGEKWIQEVLHQLHIGCLPGSLGKISGTIISQGWNGVIPLPRIVSPLPRHPPYLNRSSGGHAATWYIEMARGCPYQCAYCELGHTTSYRPQETDLLVEALGMIDPALSKRVSFFAPDEASHPGYPALLEEIHRLGLRTSFGSMRMEQVLRRSLSLRSNMLVRTGVDGLTQDTRYRVNKKISNTILVRYLRSMADNGHTNFKMFMMFGYPWEVLSDFDEFERVMDAVFADSRKKNIHLRVKWTPLIPQPGTPLEKVTPLYNPAMVERIRAWHKRVAKPYRSPGWYVECDGLMSQQNHARQVDLSRR